MNTIKSFLKTLVLAVSFFVSPLTLNAHQSTEEDAPHLYTAQAEMGELVAFPEVTAYVQKVGMKLAKVSYTPDLPFEFMVFNGSEPNAMAFPNGKIAITRGFLDMIQTEAELAAILAHEIGHQYGYEREKAATGHYYKALEKMKSHPVKGFVEMVNNVFDSKLMRDSEFEADRLGVEYMYRAGYDVRAANDMLRRFGANEPKEWHMNLTGTHPSSAERIAQNNQTMKRFPPRQDSFVGREVYTKTLNSLKVASPAYDLYQRGERALAQGDAWEAIQLAEQAITALSKEALFHGLLGKAKARSGQLQEALKAFNQALVYNQNYFEIHLHRGIALKSAGKLGEAQMALERGQHLFRTPLGDYHLGDLAQKRQHYDVAMDFFRMASSSDSHIGQKARDALSRLEEVAMNY